MLFGDRAETAFQVSHGTHRYGTNGRPGSGFLLLEIPAIGYRITEGDAEQDMDECGEV